ncbi:hypothetical protein [Streptomyces sp. NPDC053560]|uniref:hypothetical protein n=1 Tax=Streptomyces sp. NPDC053560 TaxID=3365711 RepID=UPI0037CEFB90
MRDLPRDVRSVPDVAKARIALSEDPEAFQRLMRRSMTALNRGADLATAAWTAADPVALAAEIEALAGLRRLNTCREDAP